MGIISDLLKGFLALSIFALIQNGCSVRNMAERALDAHKKGLTSYGTYSRELTGHQESWAKPINSNLKR